MKPLSLKNRRILVGVTGGIAAYKAVDIIRSIKSEGASVTVLMTEASMHFVSPLTFESLSDNKVYTDIFSEPMAHIRLPKDADLFLVAPATANIIGKLASGIADDMISLSFLAFNGPAVFSPAMNWRMYEHPLVQRNIKVLKEMGLQEVVPEQGELACGDYGTGRMASVERIVEAVKIALSKQDLKGLKVLVTAGPTREYIDPVRFISNRSSARMGYALAQVAKRRGAKVALISGPTMLEPPSEIKLIKIETSSEMLKAIKANVKEGIDLFVMAAAVADFTPKRYSSVKKEKEKMTPLELMHAPDIIKEVSKMKKRPFIIGFSAETGPNITKAKKKYESKGMDFIVFNDVTLEGAGFDSETNKISIIDIIYGVQDFPFMSKEECAEVIFDHYLKFQR